MGAPRKFTFVQEDEIVRRYQSGETQAAIAKSLGVVRGTIVEVLRRNKVKTRHHQRAVTPEQETEIVRRFNAGEKARQIAVEFGIDHTTVSKITRRCGGELRRKGRQRKFASREEWLAHPQVRLRKLLQTARSNAVERGRNLSFDEKLLDVLPPVAPTHCACCGIELDYRVYTRVGTVRDRSPSLDRCDNEVGYEIENVYVICWHCNRAKSNSTLSKLESIVAYMKRHVERVGEPRPPDDAVVRLLRTPFPYPEPLHGAAFQLEFERLRHLSLTLDGGEIRPQSLVGLALCTPLFPHRYIACAKSNISAVDAWRSPTELGRAVRFQRNQGDPLTPDRVLRAITLRCRTPTIFRPAVARFVYERYTHPGAVVWDPCAGYGGRLLGAMAAGVQYIGTDVDEATVQGNRELARLVGGVAEVHRVGAEVFDPPAVDLVFTSPPYFDRERYSNNEQQSWKKHAATWDDWMEGFIRPVIERAYRALRGNGKLVLNVADLRERRIVLPIVSRTIDVACESGFHHVETLLMPLASINRVAAFEPLLVFSKSPTVGR